LKDGSGAVSRYKVEPEPGNGPGAEDLWAFNCALCPTYRSEVGCPGITAITNLSWEQQQMQKV